MISFFQPSPSDPFSPSKVFTFLFVMIGPLKVIGPFAKTIITPYGAALLILLMSLRSGQTTILLGIIGIAGLVLVLDLVAMLTADRILTTPAVRPTLGILGSVLSVLQVALGVQAIVDALRLLGVPALSSG